MGGRPGKLALPENYGVEEWREQRKDCGWWAKLITLRTTDAGAAWRGRNPSEERKIAHDRISISRRRDYVPDIFKRGRSGRAFSRDAQ
jgi:hypothetical protein